ncbi:MAG TPA: hypothetical protein VN783_02415, partial [Thermoanaerobaculia bacterium]|nr:hypothetical protein [Thermoanaerobaculia bacterium]
RRPASAPAIPGARSPPGSRSPPPPSTSNDSASSSARLPETARPLFLSMSASVEPPSASHDPRKAVDLWFEEGDRAVATENPRAALPAFEQAAAACLRAGDPGREIAARLEIAAATFHLERFGELERAISRLDDLARRKNLPEGVLVRARVFARIARSACERGEIAAFFLLVHQVRHKRRPALIDPAETDVRNAESEPTR